MDARAAVTALLLSPLVFPHAANVRVLHHRRPARLLFTASVVARDQAPRGFTPSPDIYSLSSTGHEAQLTFTGGDSPVPSPDGRLVAFARGGDLWLMSADGRHQRLLARRGLEPAWSSDSRWIAYASGTPSDIAGIRVIDANGTADRMLVRGNIADPVWSPDRRSLAFVRTTTAPNQPPIYQVVIVRNGRQRIIARASGNGALSWSAESNWLAYDDCTRRCGVAIVRPNGGGRRFVAAGSDAIWSPRGSGLAYIQNGAIALYNGKLLTGGVLVAPTRGLTGPLSWSPDGSKIAYEVSNSELERGQLETVSLGGRVRSLGTYPNPGAPVWTAPPPSLHYRPAQPGGPLAVGDELRFRLPVEEIAADGNSVAYRTCGAIGVWATASETVTAVRSELPLCNFQDDYLQFYSLALAANRVAWGQVDGGNVQGSALAARSTANPADQIALAAGPPITSGDPRGTARAGYLLASGSLLVFSTWAYCDQFANNTCWQLPPQQRPLVSQTLWRVREPSWPGICPGLGYSSPPSGRCQQLRVEPGPLRPLDVDAGRIVASGDNATVFLDANGTQLLSLPISTQAAQLAGSDLVVVVQDELRDYDAMTGALLHTYPLPFVSSGGFCGVPAWLCGYAQFRLEDAARGLVAYVAGGPRPVGDTSGQLHLLRLADGRDDVVHAATAARFDDAGLVYAYTTSGIWPGRIRFIPFDRLPVR